MGVFHSESGEVPTQHSFRAGRDPGTILQNDVGNPSAWPVDFSIRGLGVTISKDGVPSQVPADAVVPLVDSVRVGCLLPAHHQN